jgi:hypothetical protein
MNGQHSNRQRSADKDSYSRGSPVPQHDEQIGDHADDHSDQARDQHARWRQADAAFNMVNNVQGKSGSK